MEDSCANGYTKKRDRLQASGIGLWVRHQTSPAIGSLQNEFMGAQLLECGCIRRAVYDSQLFGRSGWKFMDSLPCGAALDVGVWSS